MKSQTKCAAWPHWFCLFLSSLRLNQKYSKQTFLIKSKYHREASLSAAMVKRSYNTYRRFRSWTVCSRVRMVLQSPHVEIALMTRKDQVTPSMMLVNAMSSVRRTHVRWRRILLDSRVGKIMMMLPMCRKRARARKKIKIKASERNKRRWLWLKLSRQWLSSQK